MQGSEFKPGERVKNVSFTEDTLSVDLVDGRTIVAPLVWYPRLLWPEIDEDLSTAGLLRGAPAADRVWARS
ncbi:MAG: DUF2442 domain-containing protein [Bryobacteraceae bacterium]|jgi:hypothetical protein